MSKNPTIPSVSASAEQVCKPTQWFIRRAIAMLVMFAFFSLWFFKDGQWTYRKDNLAFYMHQLFAQEVVNHATAQNYKSAGEWQQYARAQKVKFPEDGAKVLPVGTELDQAWPEEAVNAYENDDLDVMWEAYTRRVKMDSDVAEQPHTARQIRDQLVLSGVCGFLAIIVVFFLMRTLGRTMRVDAEAFYAPGGKKVLYSSMRRIDARKWQTKGVAMIFYEDEEAKENKVKVDGLVYGDFKKEQGEPAEKLYQQILANFRGEIIEYADEDEEGESAEQEETESTQSSK